MNKLIIIRNTILFIFIFFYCCNSSKTTDSSINKIIFNRDFRNQIKLSSVCDEINFISLESSRNCLIGNINKIVINDNYVYILDNISNSIYCFNIKGKFEFKINNAGNGPGQYIKIKDFVINCFNNSIDIYDSGKRHILIYDLKGNYIKTLKFKIGLRYFLPVDKKNYIIFTNKLTLPSDNKNYAYDIIIIDYNGRVKKKYFHYEPTYSSNSISGIQSLSKFNSKIYVNLVYDERIYLVRNNNLVPQYYVDFGKDELTSQIKKLQLQDLFNILKKDIYSYYPIILGENENYIFLEYMKGKNFQYAIFNKKDHTTINYKKIINDINEIPVQRVIKVISQNSPDTLKFDKSIIFSHNEEFMHGYLYSNEIDNLSSVIPEFNIYNNPIIVLFKLKKNFNND